MNDVELVSLGLDNFTLSDKDWTEEPSEESGCIKRYKFKNKVEIEENSKFTIKVRIKRTVSD